MLTTLKTQIGWTIKVVEPETLNDFDCYLQLKLLTSNHEQDKIKVIKPAKATQVMQISRFISIMCFLTLSPLFSLGMGKYVRNEMKKMLFVFDTVLPIYTRQEGGFFLTVL